MVKLKCYTAAQTQLAATVNAKRKQRYLCSDCGRMSRAIRTPMATPKSSVSNPARYHERSSLRGLARTLGVSRNTVTSWLKKRGGAAWLSATL